MNTKEKIQTDLTDALKKGFRERVGALRLVMAEVKNREIEKRGRLAKEHSGEAGTKLDEMSALTDEEVMRVLSSEAKKRQDAAEQFDKGGRPELAKKERRELAILREYLPQQISVAEIRIIVQTVIEREGDARQDNFGAVIKKAMAEMQGRADGKTVSAIVHEELGKQ